MVKKRTNFRLTRKAVLAAALVLIVLIGLLLIWRHKKTVTTIPVAQPGAAAKSTGDKQATPPPSAKPGSSPSPSPASTSPPVSSVDTTPPANPSGQFVNFHTRSLSGDTSEESTCITTPGASCYIEFINGNTTKKLPSQTTDSSGATVWDWDIKSAGLSAGTWQVTAIASLNSQTRSTTGAPLEVDP